MRFVSLFRLIFLIALLVFAGVLICLTPQAYAQQPTPARQLQQGEPIKTLPGKTKRWALVIGVDEYSEGQITRLSGATNDAHAIADALIKYAGFPKDQVTLLASDQPTELQPRRSTILRYFSNLRGLVPKDGLLFVSFAGHGIERSGRAFLLPSDALGVNDVALLEDTAISVERLTDLIRATQVSQVVLVLDACRNDPAPGRSSGDNLMTSDFSKSFDFGLRNEGVSAFVTLYATEVGQRAYEYRTKKQGYFTWTLVEGLRGAAANERGEVTLAGLLKYVQETVPKYVHRDLGPDKQQKPFAIVEGYRADELVMATTRPDTSAADAATVATEIGSDKTAPSTGIEPESNMPMRGNAVLSFLSKDLNLVMASNEFTDPLASLLAKNRLSVTLASKLPQGELKKLANTISALRAGKKSAARSSGITLFIEATVSLSDLSPYDGLNVAEVNGSIEAVSMATGRTVARENISRVRGFGNNHDQARRNALKNAADGVSESFIKQVAANAN